MKRMSSSLAEACPSSAGPEEALERNACLPTRQRQRDWMRDRRRNAGLKRA